MSVNRIGRVARFPLGSIALVNSLGDYGISTYTWELANGLAANGVSVDVFGSGSAVADLPPARHGFYPVLGGVLFRQRDILRGKTRPLTPARAPASPVSASMPQASCRRRNALLWEVRKRFVSSELALYLRAKGYDVIWTQWPNMEGYGTRFWKLCKTLGMKLVHTVHNVVPHEESAADHLMCEKVYQSSDLLFVHSEYTREELRRLFPKVAVKTAVARYGAYTVYARRPEARSQVRAELGIDNRRIALLFCGLVRPYKNVESIIGALADERCSGTVLVVAGRESGYAESSTGDPLARTRALAATAGVSERVRFIPRFLSNDELAELLEAVDVMMLPYLKSYGSGQLLLGMTFGKYIVATAAGGMGEYLRQYPLATVLRGSDTAHVIEGIVAAQKHFCLDAHYLGEVPPELQWPNIARSSLEKIRDTFWG